MDFRTYLALEVALTRRLQADWRKLSGPLYTKIAEAAEKKDWDTARRLAQDLDMTQVGERNREFIKYTLLATAVFGAGMAGATRPAFLADPEHDGVMNQATSNMLQYLKFGATTAVQAEALQLIANAEAHTVLKRETDEALRELVRNRMRPAFAVGLQPYSDKQDFDSVTTELKKIAEAELEVFDFDLSDPYLSVDKSDKWKVTSALQKAIRRGDKVEAQRMAAASVELESFYTWKRIETIAMEDISMGDLMAVAKILATSSNRELRQKYSEPKVAAWAADCLAGAVKDRSSDDVACIAIYGARGDHAVLGQKLQDSSNQDLIEISAGSGPLVARSLAMQTLYQRCRKGGDWSRFTNLVERLELPPLAQYVSLMGSYKRQESLAPTFPLTASLAAKSVTSEIVHTPLAAMDRVLGLPAPALDGFTRTGKSSLAYLSKSSDDVRSFFEANPVTSKVEALAFALFTEEGGKLNTQVLWDHSLALSEQVDEQEFRTVGLGLAEGRVLQSIIRKDADKLLHARRRVSQREEEERVAKQKQLGFNFEGLQRSSNPETAETDSN